MAQKCWARTVNSMQGLWAAKIQWSAQNPTVSTCSAGKGSAVTRAVHRHAGAMLGTAQRHYPQKPKPVPEPNKAAPSHSVSPDSLSSVQCRGEVHAGRALEAKMLLNCGCQQKPGGKGTSRTLQRESQERLRRHKGQRGGGHGAAACERLSQRAPIQRAPYSKAGLKRHVRQRGAVLVECRAAVPRDWERPHTQRSAEPCRDTT